MRDPHSITQELFTIMAEQPILVADAYNRFIRSLRRKRRKERTVATYEYRLSQFVDMYGGFPISQVTADHVDEWLDQYAVRDKRWEEHPTRPVKKGQLSNETLRGYVQSIKTLFKFCDDRYGDQIGWHKLPTDHLERPPKIRKTKRTTTAAHPDDYLAMLSACINHPRDFALLAFFGDTAVRQGEAISLRISDLNLAACTAMVEGKTGPREVDYTIETARALRAWLDERPQVPNDYVFISFGPHSYGKPLTTEGVYLVFKRRAKEASVTRVWNPQAVRRMVAQLWADSGINPERIQLKLGHADIKTTLNWYTYQDMERVKETTREMSLVSRHAREGSELQTRGP